MRAAAVSDVGHVDGPDQAYYRIHTANMHINSFDGACARGALVDLQQRRLTFEGLVALAPSPTDVEAAQRALAIEALTSATRSVAGIGPTWAWSVSWSTSPSTSTRMPQSSDNGSPCNDY